MRACEPKNDKDLASVSSSIADKLAAAPLINPEASSTSSKSAQGLSVEVRLLDAAVYLVRSDL